SGQKVVEANPAAAGLLSNGSKHIVGRRFPDDFHAESNQTLAAFMASVRAAGKTDEVRVRLGKQGKEFLGSVSMFRQDNHTHLLVRLSPVQTDAAGLTRATSLLVRALENSPDGFVVTEPDGRVLLANRAFLDIVQAASDTQVRGRSLDQWLGRPGV